MNSFLQFIRSSDAPCFISTVKEFRYPAYFGKIYKLENYSKVEESGDGRKATGNSLWSNEEFSFLEADLQL